VQGSKLGGDVKVDGSIHTQLLYQVMNMLQSYDIQGKALNQKYNEAQSSPKRDSLAALIINQMTQLDTEKKQNFMSLAEKNPSSLAWIFPLYLQKSIDMSEDFAFLDKIEAAMYKANPDNQFMKTFHQQTDVERKTAIGFPAPDIALSDADGNIRKLSSLKGKVVLVDFWASWCGPCRKENPNVVAIYNKYHDKGFEIYSVSLDKDRDSWLKAIAKDNLLWPNHVSDLKYWKSEGAAIYGVSSIPYTVLIDRKGKIVAKRLRGEDLEKKIAELLK
jgi:thiol-disulfide isomerase/thioredoxin